MTAPAFDELLRALSKAEVEFVLIGGLAVCSAQDLRAMKRAAGRGQDLVDLENLDAAGS